MVLSMEQSSSGYLTKGASSQVFLHVMRGLRRLSMVVVICNWAAKFIYTQCESVAYAAIANYALCNEV